MNPTQRQTYLTDYLRWHTQQERIARRIASVRLKAILDNVIANLNRSSVEFTLAALDHYVSQHDHFLILQAIYFQTGPEAASREYSRLMPQKAASLAMATKDKGPDPLPTLPTNPGSLGVGFFSNRWKQRMIDLLGSSETAQRVTKLTQRTKELIRDVLVQGVAQKWDIRTTASKLASSLGGSHLSKRALLIARTETTRAANVGHEIGAMTTNLTLNKIWIATNDGRTRPSHAVAGKLKPVTRDGFFLVGGTHMKYPGDPAGGATEICNCRCVVAYIPVGYNLN